MEFAKTMETSVKGKSIEDVIRILDFPELLENREPRKELPRGVLPSPAKRPPNLMFLDQTIILVPD